MNKAKYFYFNSRDEFYRIEFSKIVFFEADGNYTNVVLCNGQKAVLGINLTQIQHVLSEQLREQARMFTRVGKRHIINLTYMYRISVLQQKLTLSDGERFAFSVSISKEALKELKDMCLNQLKAVRLAQKTQTKGNG